MERHTAKEDGTWTFRSEGSLDVVVWKYRASTVQRKTVGNILPMTVLGTYL